MTGTGSVRAWHTMIQNCACQSTKRREISRRIGVVQVRWTSLHILFSRVVSVFRIEVAVYGAKVKP